MSCFNDTKICGLRGLLNDGDYDDDNDDDDDEIHRAIFIVLSRSVKLHLRDRKTKTIR